MITEPVPKDIRDMFIQAEQDLWWLTEHDRLTEAAASLSSLRAVTEARAAP